MRKRSWRLRAWCMEMALGLAFLIGVPPDFARAGDAGDLEARMDTARTLFNEQRYHKASVTAFDVLEQPCPSLTAAEARWIVGKSLQTIGLPQLATFWYRDVVRYGRTGGSFVGRAFRAWAGAAVRLDDAGELIQRLEPLSESPDDSRAGLGSAGEAPDDSLDIDPSNQSAVETALDLEAYQYLRGVALWQSGDTDGAREVLTQVARVETLVGWQAAYLSSVLLVAGGNRDGAYNRLVPLTRGWPDMPEEGAEELEVLAGRIQDLALLGLARIQYAAGEYEDARSLYDRLSPDSEQWSRAMYEAAWTDFQLGRLDDAVERLAVLRLSVRLTQEREAFVPDAELLAALLYMWTGQYDLADGILREYLEELQKIRRALRDVVDAYARIEDAPALVDVLYDIRPRLPFAEPGDPDGNPDETPTPGEQGTRQDDTPRARMARERLPLLHPILEDLRRDRSVSGALHRVENIRADFRGLSRQMAWWQETSLCSTLRSLLIDAEQRAVFDAGRAVQAALEQYRLWLGELDVLALAYRREVTLLRLREATGDQAVPAYQGKPLPPFDFVHP